MINTSASGGHLAPVSAVTSVATAEDVIQGVLAAVTGLSGDMVRPRWQEPAPALPGHGEDWCACGVIRAPWQGYPVVRHDPAGVGEDVVTGHQRMEVLVTLYGPGARDRATALHLGLHVDQNREPLRRAGMVLDAVGEPVAAPELVNQRWLMRVDVTLMITREISSAYPVLSLTECGGHIIETDTDGL